MAGESRDPSTSDQPPGRVREWIRELRRLTPRNLHTAIEEQREVVEKLVLRFEEMVGRLDTVAPRLDLAEDGIRRIQGDVESLRDERTETLERRLDGVERAAAEVAATASHLRDEVVPTVVERGNLLVDRLAEEIEEVASLVERMLGREPLPVPIAGSDEDRLAEALSEVQPLLLESFRGTEDEIAHRLDRYLQPLRESAPVLDLGCGRGELLLLLREAGVEARGVELDPALAQAARRRGLEIEQAAALEALRRQTSDSLGAVTAIHLLEHLEPHELMHLLAEIRRVLRPGGLFLAECPNSHTLRVGAALYWLDPGHRRPLLPETLELLCTASGLEVRGLELLHPFPEEQRLSAISGELPPDAGTAAVALADRLDRLANRLDDLLNGPRDFALTARKPKST